VGLAGLGQGRKAEIILNSQFKTITAKLYFDMTRKGDARKRKSDKKADQIEGGGEAAVQNYIRDSAVRNTLLAQNFKQLIYLLSFALISYSLYHAFEERYHTTWYTRYFSLSSILIAGLLAWCIQSPCERGREFGIAGMMTISQCFIASYLILYVNLAPGSCIPLGGVLYGLVRAFWKTLMKNAMKLDSAQLKWRQMKK
jgi:hypothetical protein